MDELTGRQFGPYRIVAALGEGGMAGVYKAFQPAVNRYIALKILSRSFINDPQFLQRFRHEARILAQLQHPHILPIFDFGESDGYAFLAMPLIGGGTLASQLRGQPLSFAKTERAVRQICDALHYAHSKGIVHRDIKPSNVLLDEGGNCFLADFGIARMTEGATRLTHTGMMMGTPEYMSPEQAGGETVDLASDIYSLGIVLYELLTGRVPFKAETPVAVAIKHLTAPLPPPRSVNPALTPAIEAVVLKALARVPTDRFVSASDLAAALSAALRHAQSDQETPTVLEQTQTPIADVASSLFDGTHAIRKSPTTATVPSLDTLDFRNPTTPGAIRLDRVEAEQPAIPAAAWNWKPMAAAVAAVLALAVGAGALYNARRQATSAPPPIEPAATQPAATSSVVPTEAVAVRADPLPPATRERVPPPASKPTPQIESRQDVPPAAKADPPVRGTLLVMCDRDCTVSVDGVPAGESIAGRGLSISAGLGQHLVKAAGGGAMWENIAEVASAGQVVVRTNLAGEIEKLEAAARQAAQETRQREAAEQAERDRVARLAEQQRREQQAAEGASEILGGRGGGRSGRGAASEFAGAAEGRGGRGGASVQPPLSGRGGNSPALGRGQPSVPPTISAPEVPVGRIVATKITNESGKYSVSVPSGPCFVQFQLEGFVTQRYQVSGGTSLDVRLEVGAANPIRHEQARKGSGGSVRGTVTDRMGAALPGVTVTVFQQ